MMTVKFCVVILLLGATLAVADECDFTSSVLLNWAGQHRAAMGCMQAIPSRPSENANTTAAVRKIFEGYSFSDIVRANVAPYHLNVDWAAELTRIESTSYTGDYRFHNDIGKLFNSIGDGNLVYIKPAGYVNMFYYFPFSIVSRMVGDQQKFYGAPGPISQNVWNVICSCNSQISSFYGIEIIKIDGLNTKDWLMAFAKKGGIHLDPGVQMNNILKAFNSGFSLGMYEAPANTRINYRFSIDWSFDYHFEYIKRPNNISVVEGYNHAVSPGTRYRSINRLEADGFGQESLAQAERSVIEHLENVIRSKRSSRDPTTHRLLEIAQNHADTLKLTQEASTTFGIKLKEASSKRDFNMEHFLANHRVPLAQDRLSDISAANVAAMDLEAGFDRETALAETLRKIDASIAATQSIDDTNKRYGAATIETPLVTGDKQLLNVLKTSTNAGVAVYGDSIVLKLRKFNVDPDGDFLVALKQAHALRSTYNTEKLIIDVSGNSGGLVCLAYRTLSYLVEQWRNHSSFGYDVLYSPYDWRFSPLNEVLWTHSGIFGDETDPTTGLDMGSEVHDSPRTITYGNRTSQYSQLFHWNLCPDENFEPETVAEVRAFDKIIILTDGTCGSSCAYFVSQLRSTDKVRVVSYGGVQGLPLATSSFAGGNVYQYDALVGSAISGGYDAIANVAYMNHNAIASFNLRSNYATGDTSLPRQFIREEADWHISYWDPLRLDIYDPSRFARSDTSLQTMANIYASVTPLFNLMPSSLARIYLDIPAPPITSSPFSTPSRSPNSVPVNPSSPSSPSSPSLPSPTLPPSLIMHPSTPAESVDPSPPSSSLNPEVPIEPSVATPIAATSDTFGISPLLVAPTFLAIMIALTT